MFHDAKHRRRLAVLLALPLPALVAHISHAEAISGSAVAADDHLFTYHQQDILGTSLDLKLVAASQTDADACKQTILAEIQRLSSILSTYDAQSEISKFEANPSIEAVNVSEDLHAVLLDYLQWHNASAGAYSPQLAELIDFWTAAEKKGAIPTDQDLAPLVGKLHQNAYITSISGSAVRKLNNQPLNLDSLGKGYIVQRAAALARAKHPTVTGILLNIGGDITALGNSTPPGVKPAKPWELGVADPQQPAANAPAIITIKLTNKAVATSGVYERFFTFGEQKLSHILNPLTGRPSSNDVLSATVVANDNATANALATILCVIPDADGIKLVEKTPGASAFLVMTGGKQVRSRGFSAYESDAPPASGGAATPSAPTAPADSAPAAANAWPKNYAVSLNLSLIQYGRPTYIPYVGVWIEDANGKCVKIVAAWVGDKKYLPAMANLSKLSKTAAAEFANMTRATRKTGQYTFTWDGKDSSNNPVPTGSYTLCVEGAFEHGGHGFQRLPITCGAAMVNTSIAASPIWNKIPVTYGPGPAN